jgi:hypothetical protein
MKPSHVALALETCIKAKRPIFIWGPPGVGKSQVTHQVVKRIGLERIIEIRGALLDAVDLHGVPDIREGKTIWATPGFLPTSGTGFIFIDEMPAAPPLVQSALLQLTLDGRLGEYVLPEGWAIGAAGNRQEDRAYSSRLSTAQSDRFFHVDWEVDFNDWLVWGLTAGIRMEVIAFIRFCPQFLHQFDPQKETRAFPSPRGWEYISDVLNHDPDPRIMLDLFSGKVGRAAGTQFVGFLKIWQSLPDPDAVLMNPQNAPVPDDPQTMWALCGALTGRVGKNNAGRFMEYANRIPSEFAALMINGAIIKTPEVQNTRPFAQWVSEHHELMVG